MTFVGVLIDILIAIIFCYCLIMATSIFKLDYNLYGYMLKNVLKKSLTAKDFYKNRIFIRITYWCSSAMTAMLLYDDLFKLPVMIKNDIYFLMVIVFYFGMITFIIILLKDDSSKINEREYYIMLLFLLIYSIAFTDKFCYIYHNCKHGVLCFVCGEICTLCVIIVILMILFIKKYQTQIVKNIVFILVGYLLVYICFGIITGNYYYAIQKYYAVDDITKLQQGLYYFFNYSTIPPTLNNSLILPREYVQDFRILNNIQYFVAKILDYILLGIIATLIINYINNNKCEDNGKNIEIVEQQLDKNNQIVEMEQKQNNITNGNGIKIVAFGSAIIIGFYQFRKHINKKN